MLPYVLLLLSFVHSDRAGSLLLKCELSRFPSKAECKLWLERSDTHLRWINEQALLFPADRGSWELYRQQVTEWRNVWYEMYIAHTPPYSPGDWKRLALVREAVGEVNYRRGYVHPPIASYLLPALSKETAKR